MISFEIGDNWLQVKGLVIPHDKRRNPLGKIWWHIRPQIIEEFGVDAYVDFVYDTEREVILCRFEPNYALVEKGVCGEATYAGLWADSFLEIAEILQNVILQFANRADGLVAYATEYYSGFAGYSYDSIISVFLRNVGVRTRKKRR